MTPLNQRKEQPIASLCYFIIYIICIFFFNALPIPALLNWSHELAQQQTSTRANMVFLIVNITVAIVGFMIFYRRFRDDAIEAFRHKKKAIIWTLVFIAFYFAFAMIPFPTKMSDSEQTILNMSFTLSNSQIPFYLLMLVLTGPLAEIILYNEVIINQLSRYLPKYFLAVLSAALFSLAHIPSVHLWYQGIPYFLNMLCANILYIRSGGNLWYIFIAQVVFNASSIIIVM